MNMEEEMEESYDRKNREAWLDAEADESIYQYTHR